MSAGKSTFKFSSPTVTIDGGSTTINIVCEDQSYSHKLLHSHGEITTLTAGTTSYTWTPTADQLVNFFNEVPSQKSRSIDIYLDTYNGSTKVGRDIHSLTVTLSEATGKPTVSDFTITDSNATTTSMGMIVVGKSTLTASAKADGKYAATISRNMFTCECDGKHYESYSINDLIASLPLTTNVVVVTFGYKSTDSRGFSTTVTLGKNIVRYQAPSIKTFEVIRCDDSGNENEMGAKAKVVIKGSWVAIPTGNLISNPATLKVGYKTKDATSYTYQKITVVDGTIEISQLLSATLTTGTDYEFSVELTDRFETYKEEDIGFSNVNNILYVSADGQNLVIGSDTGNNVAIKPSGVDIRNGSTVNASFSENKIELGKNSKNSVINMCDKNGSIEVIADDGGGYGENFTITGKSGAAIRYQRLIEDPNKEGYYIPYEKAQVYVNKRVGNSHVKEAGMYAYDKTYGNASIIVSVNEPIYGNNYALIDARNIYLTADKSVTIDGSGILDINESLYIKNNKVSDFVVSEGKCDFWTYRMWNSGIAECWGQTSETTVSVTSEWGSLYDSGTGHTNGFPGNTTASPALKFNVTIGGKKYTKLFTSVEHCDCSFISSDNAFMIEIGSGLTNLQTPQVFLLRATSATVTGKYSYHAIGRWKA